MTLTPSALVKSGVLGALALAMLAVAPAASAHTSLISASPQDGEVLTEATELRLEFTDELLDLGNAVTLTDPNGGTSDLEFDVSEPRVLSAALPLADAGDYVIDWRVVAKDGHPIEDSITFTYAPTASPSPEASASPSASAPAVTAAPITMDVDGGSGSSVQWWIIGVGVVAGIGIGYLAWRSGRTAVPDA